jgi:hypothetical protein
MLFGAFVVIVLLVWFVVISVAWRIPPDVVGEGAYKCAQECANEDRGVPVEPPPFDEVTQEFEVENVLQTD